jgi:hypothetical protein
VSIRFVVAAVALAGAVLGLVGAASPEPQPLQPLLGANFIRYEERPPYCGGPAILLDYHEPGVRDLVRSQLAAMRAAGMRALRLFIYHASNVRGNDSFLSSAGGRLAEPYRTNLTEYLDDVRAAGFTSMTVTFNPWFENDPIGYTSVPYDPAKLEENWAFIADIRPLAKEHGPATTRIDLINEGAPDYWQPLLRTYVAELWARYADRFGTGDVVISIIVKTDEGGSTSRLQNLIDTLQATGRGLPVLFQVHPSWSKTGALRDLRAVDAVLRREQLAQPLVIGEEAYDAAGPAEGIAAFRRESTRPVLEVLEWPLETSGNTWGHCPSAPYRIAAYARAFGRTPYRLSAKLGSSGVSLSAAGAPVSALGAGRYSVVVFDRSVRDGFRLVVDGRRLQTGRRFHGTARWTVRMYNGSNVHYGSARLGLVKTVRVLGGG